MANLTDMQLEAMLVRAGAAHKLRKDRDLDFIDAIRLIVMPEPDVLAASLSVAEATGPSAEARRLVHVLTQPEGAQRGRAKTLERRVRRQIRSESLDQVLARL